MNKAELNLPNNLILGESIARFYNVRAEQEFVRPKLEMGGFSRENAQLYLRENVFKFLLEFAARVPKTHLAYEFNPQGELIYPQLNLPMTNLMSQAVVESQGGRREQAELVGWQRMEALLKEPNVNQVLQLSPPSTDRLDHGNYGFLFWFEKEGQRVVNHVIKYQEDRQHLRQSQLLANVLGMNFNQDVTHSLLENPIGFGASTQEVIELLTQKGLKLDNRGYRFEEQLKKDPLFRFYLEQYIWGVERNYYAAEEALKMMYELAVTKASGSGLVEGGWRDLPVFSGGSCPAIGQAGYSTYSGVNYLLPEPFTCPKCGRVSYVPIGNQCPGCGVTKEQWAAEHETEVCD